jgi:hypothetical protein
LPSLVLSSLKTTLQKQLTKLAAKRLAACGTTRPRSVLRRCKPHTVSIDGKDARFGGRPLLRGDDENQRYGNEQEQYRKEEGLPVRVGEL